jgi:hypothetical protein
MWAATRSFQRVCCRRDRMILWQVSCVWLLAAGIAPAPVYRSEVALPVELYTAAGTRLEARKYQIEIRLDEGRYGLAFLENDKLIDSVPGRPQSEGAAFTVPLMGAVLLWPVDPKEKGEPKSKLSPYLTNISWQAVLRVYRSRESSNSEVRALLRVAEKTVEFQLYLEKPASAVTSPVTPPAARQ